MHEGKGKAYDKREKGKAGAVKGKRGRPRTQFLIRDPTRQPDRAHARTHNTKRFPGWTPPPTSNYYCYYYFIILILILVLLLLIIIIVVIIMMIIIIIILFFLL